MVEVTHSKLDPALGMNSDVKIWLYMDVGRFLWLLHFSDLQEEELRARAGNSSDYSNCPWSRGDFDPREPSALDPTNGCCTGVLPLGDWSASR